MKARATQMCPRHTEETGGQVKSKTAALQSSPNTCFVVAEAAAGHKAKLQMHLRNAFLSNDVNSRLNRNAYKPSTRA